MYMYMYIHTYIFVHNVHAVQCILDMLYIPYDLYILYRIVPCCEQPQGSTTAGHHRGIGNQCNCHHLPTVSCWVGIHWGGDTPKDCTKPRQPIQRPDRLYKAPERL